MISQLNQIPTFSNRVKAGGLLLPAHQAVFHPTGLKHEVSLVPSTSQPNWGGYYILDLKEKNISLDNVSIVLNVSPLTLADNGNLGDWLPAFINIYGWFSRIEFVQNNIIIDTYYPSQQFILNQIIHDDKERLTINNTAGNYASREQRVTKASMRSEYILNLRSIVDQTKLSVLELHDEIQIRAYLNPLADVIDWTNYPTNADVKDFSNQDSSAVLLVPQYNNTPYATIQSSSLTVKHTKLNQSGLNILQVKERKKQPHSSIFHDVRYALNNITMSGTGIQQFNIVLSSIVGSVALIHFTIRNTDGLKNENTFYYLDFHSFDILDSSGSSMVGGTPITFIQNQKLLHQWSRSTYSEETLYNANYIGKIEDNGANVGCWSFSDDPIDALRHGRALSSHKFSGNEVLRLYIDSSTPYYSKLMKSNVFQIDIYAYCENLHNASGFDIKKFAI